MLERDTKTGKISIGVCTAQGLLTHWLDLNTGEMTQQDTDEDPSDNSHNTCSYAASPAPMGQDGILRIATLTRQVLPCKTHVVLAQGFIGQADIRLAARGPPSST